MTVSQRLDVKVNERVAALTLAQWLDSQQLEDSVNGSWVITKIDEIDGYLFSSSGRSNRLYLVGPAGVFPFSPNVTKTEQAISEYLAR